MTEEKMQGEARQAFLVDTLQKLLGQDSPTGFTERVVTVAEKISGNWDLTPIVPTRAIWSSQCPVRESGHKVGLCAMWIPWA